jgi:photosystem II stability/assembly factor-like uncharacterized protein
MPKRAARLPMVMIFVASASAASAAWVSQGPFGGPVDSVAVDAVNHAVYAGNFGGGVLKSTDAGLHWAPVNAGFGNGGEMTINGLAASPSASGRLIVGTQNGVWLTTNGGASWAATNLVAASPGVEAPDVRAVAFAPSDTTRAYAAQDGSGGVWRSVDSGAHWTSSVVGITDTFLVALAVDPTSPDTVYAGTYNGSLFKSTDGGKTWKASESGLANASVESLLVDPVQPATVIAGTSNGFYRSTDHGATWHPVPGADDATYSLSAGHFGNIATLYSASRSSGILASTNHGASWSRLDQNLTNLDPEAFVLDSSTGVAYAAIHTEGFDGVQRSVNAGVTWSPATNGYAAQYVPAVAFDPQSSTNILAGTYGNGVFRSDDAGATWSRTSLPAFVVALLFDRLNPSVAYAVGGNDGRVIKSVNGGKSWSSINNGLGSSSEFQALAQSGSGSVLLTGDYTGAVYRSTDGGASWHPSGTGLTATSINGIAADPHASGTFFASTDASIFKTTDGGLHWTPSAAGYPAGSPGGIAVDSSDSHVVLAASILDFPALGKGAFRSTDGGGTWTPVGGPLANETVWTFAADPAHAGVLYAGTFGGGVYRSADHGATWTLFTRTGLTNLRVVALAVSTDGSSIQAGTDSTSTFRYGPSGRGAIKVPAPTTVRKVRPRP